jgi:Kef-type K+ transport system membrane component KefB
LLAALQSGTIFGGLRLPRLTGYLLCGFLAGPSVANLVTERMLADLKLVNGVAIGLIALTAGGELNFRKLRGKLGAIVSTGGGVLLTAMIAITAVVFVLSPFLGFMGQLSVAQRAVVALTMGVVFSALSPTVTLALISETGSAGPISDMALGIVVVGDLVIVFAFAAVNALASGTFGGSEAGGLGALLFHIFGSVGAGVVLAIVLLLFLRYVNRRVALFVFGICFLCAEAGTRVHLDPLLTCLTAGLFLENLTDVQGRVPPDQRKWLHFAFYSQSGVAIGLAVLIKQRFEGWGEGASACLLGGVMINEMIGPVLFKTALARSGEVGRRAAQVVAH